MSALLETTISKWNVIFGFLHWIDPKSALINVTKHRFDFKLKLKIKMFLQKTYHFDIVDCWETSNKDIDINKGSSI